ncbi:MAG: tetratricopeptide repeat protein [Bacteroidales bacterium]|nr:tetratricopeptide repeat protein [Bacteroidales bacterium]
MKKLLLIIGLLTLSYVSMAQLPGKIDSLEVLLPEKTGVERSEILMQLSGLYQSSNPQKSLEYDLENVEIQKNLGSIKNLSGTLNNIGISYYLMGDYGKSMDYFEQSLILREQLNDTLNIVKTLNNLGVIAQTSGDFTKALEYLNRSLIFKLDLNDTLSIAKTLNNIGVIYKDVNNFDDAGKFLNQALDFYQAVNNFSGIAAAYNNLGQVFEALKLSDSALVYYQKSLEIKRQINDERGIGNTLNNLGMIQLSKGLDKAAETYFMECVNIRKRIGDNFGLASTLNNLGNLYFGRKNYSKAEAMFFESNDIATHENLLGIQQRNYAGLSRLYEQTGKMNMAFTYYKKYAEARDSVFDMDLKNQIADLKVKYESEKSKRENEMLRQENEIKDLKISNGQKERMQFITGIISLFFASVLIVLFLQYWNNRKLNAQLQLHNRQLEVRVKERTRELEEANATKDRFFSIIAHDLKGPFNGLLGFADLLFNDFEMLSEQKKKEFSGFIKESASDIYKLLENLLEWASSQTGRIQLSPEKLDVAEIISETIKANQLMLHNKRIEISKQINTSHLALADEDTIKVVIRNLLTNAIKFTPKGGRINFTVEDFPHETAGRKIIIKLKDTGVGIKNSDIRNLFNLKEKFKSPGTEKESGTGLGLILCKDFIEKNGGELFVESEPGVGSTFSFTLPAA